MKEKVIEITKNGGVLITMTYATPVRRDEAEKRLNSFMKHNFKNKAYISNTHDASNDSKRVHHHIIASGIETKDIEVLWLYGRILISKISDSTEGFKAANYIFAGN